MRVVDKVFVFFWFGHRADVSVISGLKAHRGGQVKMLGTD